MKTHSKRGAHAKEGACRREGAQSNRPFPNYLQPLPQSESWCPSFHMKMRFHSHVN